MNIPRPSKRRGRPRHTNKHSHTQYTLFDECIAPGPNVVSPLAGRTGWPQRHSRRVRTPHPHTDPHSSPPQFPQISQLAQAARAWRRPVPPPEWRGHSSVRAPRRVRDLACCAQNSASGEGLLHLLVWLLLALVPLRRRGARAAHIGPLLRRGVWAAHIGPLLRRGARAAHIGPRLRGAA